MALRLRKRFGRSASENPETKEDISGLNSVSEVLAQFASGPPQPSLHRAWVDMGVGRSLSQKLASTGVRPSLVQEFFRSGYQLDRVGVLVAYAHGQLHEFPAAALDRVLLNHRIDVTTSAGASAFAVADQINETFGYDWDDAALIAASGIDIRSVVEIAASFPDPPAPEVLLEIRRYSLPPDLVRDWMLQGMSIDDVRAAHRAGVSLKQLADFRGLGLKLSETVEAAQLWGVEDPRVWMDLLSCTYGRACEWRSRFSDLRLASQWQDTVERPEIAGAFLDAGVVVGEVVGWTNVGVVGVESVLRHREFWTASECSDWRRDLSVGPDEALDWRESGVPLGDCVLWRSRGRNLDEARRAQAANLTPHDDTEFGSLGVRSMDEVLLHHFVWRPSELSEWLTVLGVTAEVAIQWRSVCDNPGIASEWIAAQVEPAEAGEFIEVSLVPDDRARWAVVGVEFAQSISVLVSVSVTPDTYGEWRAVLSADVERIRDWVLAGVDVGFARMICDAKPDLDEALRWARLGRPIAELLRLIGDSALIDDVEAFIGIGVTDIEEICAALHAWKPSQAREWMTKLRLTHAEALEWFETGGTIQEAQICGSPSELFGWIYLGVREGSGIEKIRQVMTVEAARSWLAAGWLDLSSALVWFQASEEPGSRLDAVSALEWEPTGLEPHLASEFIRGGFSAGQVTGWLRLGLTTFPELAGARDLWSSLDEAASWCGEMSEPIDVVSAWRREFDDISLVTGWYRLGDLEVARQWTALGCTPMVAELWMRAGFNDLREVANWSEHGFDAESAIVWRDLGVEARSAARLQGEGLSSAAFRRVIMAFPGLSVEEALWIWSLEEAGLEAVDEIPTLDARTGRPSDCRLKIESFLRDCSDCGVEVVRIRHHGGQLDPTLVSLLHDPVFVRGAGRIALTDWESMNPDICIEAVEHSGVDSIVRLSGVLPRARVFRTTQSLRRVA
jgi:hypothetical protein